MTNWSLPPEWLNALLAGVYEAQQWLRACLHALGLAPAVHGELAWPFAWRVAGELLVREPALARRVSLSLACVLLALLMLLAAVGWRRRRRLLGLLAAVPLLLAPWPQLGLLLAPAWPTSFHHSPTGFSAESIVAGQAVYREHCLRCHGADGRGEGSDAAKLPMWPPTLNNTLMWRRLEGELFHHVREGLRGRDGVQTMPGFSAVLDGTQVWQVLDYLQAKASGQTLREGGAWVYPVHVPDAPVHCRQGRPASLTGFRGMRLRLVVPAPGEPVPMDDPRFETVVLGASADADVNCRTDTPALAEALALLLGVSPDELPGHQVLVDRDGWLRVRGEPGTAWSERDMVCRSEATRAEAPSSTGADGVGLDALIRRMDAEPVLVRRGGFPH